MTVAATVPLTWSTIDSTPSVIDQVAAMPPAPPTTVWYYCRNPAGYFPYVQNCNQAWVPVTPQALPPGPAN